MTINEGRKNSPPYVSYKTFEHFLSRLEQQLPACIDRSYWGKMYSGSVGTQLLSAMRFLNLIDSNAKPMPRLKLLVSGLTGEHRAVVLRQTAEEAYAFVFKGILDLHNASYTDLVHVFQNTYHMKISVCRKCIRFFMEFSKDAGIPLAPQITKKRKMSYTDITERLKLRCDVYSCVVVHPGKYLKEELLARNISQEELASRLGMPLDALNKIIEGREAITTETALQLETLMPMVPARFWLYLQSDFQLAKALAMRTK